MLNTPILLITFNRPNHTRKVLERILEANPCDLYVFQDGAREGNEADVVKCQQVRDVINELVTKHQTPDTQHQTPNTQHQIPITLHTNYSSINLGCGPGPFTAISWFFQNVEYGIIFEDDIIPHPLFFSFMETILTRYANDNRIGMVAGHNFYRKYSLGHSYYLTFDTEGTLGWGTWRRVWQGLTFDIKVEQKPFENSLIHNYGMPKCYAHKEYEHFRNVLDVDRHDRWDYQWEYYLKLHGYLNIKPNSCLTTHDDGGDATHKGCYFSPNYQMEVHEAKFYPIRHPRRVRIDLLERLRVLKRTLKLLMQR